MNSYYVTLNENNFEREVIQSDLPVLVEFGADWCGTCHILEPIFEEINKDFKQTIKIGKVDVDQNWSVKEAYGIFELPTILFFKNGTIVDHIVGAVPKKIIVSKIGNLLSGCE
jgi:thioredoxin 1